MHLIPGHDTYLDVEPVTGEPFRLAERLQINLKLDDWDLPQVSAYIGKRIGREDNTVYKDKPPFSVAQFLLCSHFCALKLNKRFHFGLFRWRTRNESDIIEAALRAAYLLLVTTLLKALKKWLKLT